MFMGWFDDTKKKDPKEKLEEAIQYYIAKFGTRPTLCLVNAEDATTYDGIEVKVVEYVRPNHFWVGRSEAAIAAEAEEQAPIAA